MSMTSVPPAVYFDESLFVDGSIVQGYATVAVGNRADEYLVRRCGKKTAPIRVGVGVAVNPDSPCGGVNIYTMSRRHRDVYRTYRFGEVRVTEDAAAAVPVTIGERVPNTVYDFNANLTPVEMAIMLKHHAVNRAARSGGKTTDGEGPVRITPRLYMTVFEYFDHAGSSRRNALKWLDDALTDRVVQLPNREIVHRRRTVNVPDLTYYGPRAVQH